MRVENENRLEVINYIIRQKMFDESPIIDGIIYEYDEEKDVIIAIGLQYISLNENRRLIFHDFCDEIVLNIDVNTISTINIANYIDCCNAYKFICNFYNNSVIYFIGNNIKNVNDLKILGFGNLKYLELNGLLEFFSLDKLEKLEVLKLESVISLPSLALSNLENLKEIYLSNKLKSLSTTWITFEQRYLYIYFNGLMCEWNELIFDNKSLIKKYSPYVKCLDSSLNVNFIKNENELLELILKRCKNFNIPLNELFLNIHVNALKYKNYIKSIDKSCLKYLTIEELNQNDNISMLYMYSIYLEYYMGRRYKQNNELLYKCWLYICKYALECDNQILDKIVFWLNF